MGQVGIPLFYLQGMGGGAVLKFRDLFNDASQFWGWRLFLGELTTVGKSGTEANGRFALQVNNAVNGEWGPGDNEAPRLFVGVLSYPCEIKTRIDLFTANPLTYGALFISKSPTNFGAGNYFSIGRYENGIHVTDTVTTVAQVVDATLPVWVRIRLGCGAYKSLHAYFDYSFDGLNWVNLWVQSTGWVLMSGYDLATGLFVRNGAGDNLVTAEFDFFQMLPKSIN